MQPARNTMQTIFRSNAGAILRTLRNLILSKTGIDRDALACIYLSGNGIEIGALHVPTKLPRSAKVRYVDRLSIPELRKHYPELNSHKIAQVEIICDGETLDAIEDSSQDFVIANHFLGHCENPIKALTNLVRVLRSGGILFLSIPDKRYTFDKNRQVTSFSHLVQDFVEGPSLSRNEHFRDWATNVENKMREETIQRRVGELTSMNYSIHFHVWTQKEMCELFFRLKEQFLVPIELQLFMKRAGEVVFIFKKET